MRSRDGSNWVRPDGAGPNNDEFGNNIIVKSVSGIESIALGWRATDNRCLFVFVGLTDKIISTNTFAPGSFYHLAGTYDGSIFRLYVNAQLEGELVSSNGLSYNPAIPWTIGSAYPAARNSGYYRTWNGVVDEVAIYDHALTQEQINLIVTVDSAGIGRNLGNTGSGATLTYA